MKMLHSLTLLLLGVFISCIAHAGAPYSVSVTSLNTTENCSISVSGLVQGTAVSIDFIPEYGDSVRLVTNTLPADGNYKWGGPIPNYSSIPPNSKIRVYTNRLIHADSPLPVCTPPHAITLTPNTNEACYQKWVNGGVSYGPKTGPCINKESIDQTSAFYASKGFCHAKGLDWFDYNVTGGTFNSSTLITSCRRSPLENDTYFNRDFNVFMNAVMNDPTLFASFKSLTQKKDIVALANTSGYTLTQGDLNFPAPVFPPSRHAHAQSTCGLSGDQPCVTSKCDHTLTVYFPFNFCCIPEYSTCTARHNVSQCLVGESIDQFGHCTPGNVVYNQALTAGCRSNQEVQEAFTHLSNDPNIGSITREWLNKYKDSDRSQWVTTLDVNNSKTCAFRAIASSREGKSLQNGFTYSKAQDKVDYTYKGDQAAIDSFWGEVGPQLTPNDIRSEEALALQMLSLQSSSTPTSQFSSVSTEFKEHYWGDRVYGFYVNPNSPIIGLKNCEAEKDNNEVQYQIPSGSPITSLHRKLAGKEWEKYKKGTKQWVKATSSNSEFLRNCL